MDNDIIDSYSSSRRTSGYEPYFDDVDGDFDVDFDDDTDFSYIEALETENHVLSEKYFDVLHQLNQLNSEPEINGNLDNFKNLSPIEQRLEEASKFGFKKEEIDRLLKAKPQTVEAVTAEVNMEL